MLQSINDKFKGWITWIIIITVSAVFILTGISYFFVSGVVSPNFVAKVGNAEISQNSYQKGLSQNMQVQPLVNQKTLQQQTLDQLVDQKLLQQDAASSNIVITNSAVLSAIFQNSAFTENSEYSAKRFDEIAKLYGGGANIKALFETDLLTSSIVKPLMQSQFVLTNEQKSLGALMGQKREITYYEFPAKIYENKVIPTEKELENYYDKHKSDYAQIEQVVVSYVKLSSQDFVSNSPVDEGEINSYYQANKDLLMSPELRTYEVISINNYAKDSKSIADKIKANKILTTDELKEVNIEKMRPLTLREALGAKQFSLFSLTMECPIKEINDNKFVKLTNITSPILMTLDEKRPVIEKILKNRTALAQFNEVLTSINRDSFDELVKKNNFKTEFTKTFDKNTSGAVVEGNAKLQEEIFDYNKIQGFILQGQFEGIIYKVDQRIPKHTLSFAQVKDKIMAAYIHEQSFNCAKESATEVLNSLNDNKLVTAVQVKTKEISHGDLLLDQNLKNIIFSDGIKSYNLVQNGQVYWVYKVTKVIDGRDQVPTEVLENHYNNIEVNNYLKSLKDQYPVEFNHQVIQ